MTRLPPSLWLLALALGVSALTQPGGSRADRRARAEVEVHSALVVHAVVAATLPRVAASPAASSLARARPSSGRAHIAQAPAVAAAP